MIANIIYLLRYIFAAVITFMNPIVYLLTDDISHLFISPVSILISIFAIGSYLGSEYCFKQLFSFDVTAATFLFGTTHRTISGVVGQYSYYTGKKRWKSQAFLIDRLATFFGDEPRHCHRIFLSEIKLI